MDIELICQVLTQARNRKDFEASGVILTLLDELGVEILDHDRDLYWWNRATGEQTFVGTSKHYSVHDPELVLDQLAPLPPENQPITLSEMSDYDLLSLRDTARQAKNWGEADAIRAEIERRGSKVIDTKQGSKLIR